MRARDSVARIAGRMCRKGEADTRFKDPTNRPISRSDRYIDFADDSVTFNLAPNFANIPD